jgi:hypothetical protein
MHIVKSKTLLQNDKCLVMQPEIIKIAGKSAALLLQQIHYWIENEQVHGKMHQGKKWIANSYDSWASDLKIVSKSTIGRCISILKNLRLIFVETLSEFKSNRTNWYTINYNRISEILNISPLNNSTKNNSDFEDIQKQKHISNRLKISVCPTQNESMYIDKKTNKDNLINLIKSESFQSVINDTEKPLTQQLIDIWNEIINPEVNSQLNKNRCRYLIAAFKYKFNKNITKWKDYCRKITSSDFLMGKIKNCFKISLDTALKFDFIQKVFEKQFGIKELQIPVEIESSSFQEIENTNISLEVKKIHYEIYEKIGSIKYNHWFRDIKIIKTSTSIDIFVPNSFKKNWIENNYQSDLQFLLGIKIRILKM